LNWLGPWNATSTYQLNDAVHYAGSAWVALRATLNIAPVEGPDWTLLAQKGDVTGLVGPQGPPGPAAETVTTNNIIFIGADQDADEPNSMVGIGTDGITNLFLFENGFVGLGTNHPATALHVKGTVTAEGFSGNGAGLSGLNASQLTSGTIPTERIPVLDASKITAGTFADARLSSNVARLDAHQTFAASNRFIGVVTMSNPSNTLAGSFSGNGSGLTNVNADLLDGQHGAFYLNAASLNAGTLADARLSGT
jgi:hypothetical protein